MDKIRYAAYLAGSQTKLADLLGITPQAVQRWCSGAVVVPADRAKQVERVLDGKVTRIELRPDLFGSKDVIEVITSDEAA